MHWGVKSTIKTKVQFEFARLVPYGPLPRTMLTLEFTAHEKNQERLHMRKRITDNQPENLCKAGGEARCGGGRRLVVWD